jgi:uncharacterized protein YecE (DUF72 family)
MARVLIGTSGWSYKHWENGHFYPPKLPAEEFLPYFAKHFPTVEINFSYYKLPPRTTFQQWARKAPSDFVFAVKASRYLTHMKKLKDPEEPLERFVESAGGLGKKFGPVLLQFPAQWKLNLPRLLDFMSALRSHPKRRYAFEFRHRSWLTAEVYECLRENNAALCLPVGWGIPLDAQITADFAYVRFHGGERTPFFEDDELRPWARRIRAWRDEGLDSYGYFNNDTLWHDRPAAIDNASRLREMIEG